ncbi:MAG: TetR/AcrR family transcriptional regulator [Dehalococcoidia bacterium]
MSTTAERRRYEMRRRQDDIAETRKRIVEAAVDLHGSVGPAHTTFSAVAERAGVQRSTVYRHFADEEALFGACTSHWLAQNPWPSVEDWARHGPGEDRLAFALKQLYGYFERNEQMLANSFRDIQVMPSFVGEFMGAQLAAYRQCLSEGWKIGPLAGFVIDFRTWQALRDAGHSSTGAAATLTRMVTATAE